MYLMSKNKKIYNVMALKNLQIILMSSNNGVTTYEFGGKTVTDKRIKNLKYLILNTYLSRLVDTYIQYLKIIRILKTILVIICVLQKLIGIFYG